ncbi:hypothetical protein BMT54_01740 [Pasteurellaceae bacterium 15-036681]|nr:hypothetical protein BMT54_01740 [Pasteurellaceae bacterium 15-036681]
MAKNTKGDSTLAGATDVTVVTPSNMGVGHKWNTETKQYDIQLSEEQYNLLHMKPDGLYLGSVPTRKEFFVDFLNGSDSNDGTRERPYKSVGKAIKSVESGTIGTYIHLKEAQDHYLNESISNTDEWDYTANASYIIDVYGDNTTRIRNKWYSEHLGYQTSETLYASKEYQQFKPTLYFVGTNRVVSNDPNRRNFMTSIRVAIGTQIEVNGVHLKCKNMANVSNSAGGWFTSCFRGAGEVIVSASTIHQQDFENGHFYLANSTVGELVVSTRYLIIAGTGNLFFNPEGTFPIRVYSGWDVVTDDSMNNTANPPMNYKGVAKASEIFALTNNNNPKSFITNK